MWMRMTPLPSRATGIRTPEGSVVSGERVTPGTECLWTVILHVADLPEMGSDIVLSGKST